MSEHELRIDGCVFHSGTPEPVECAEIGLAFAHDPATLVARAYTDEAGKYQLHHAPRTEGDYLVSCEAFGTRCQEQRICVEGASSQYHVPPLDLPLDMRISAFVYSDADGRLIPAPRVAVGRHIVLRVDALRQVEDHIARYEWRERSEARITQDGRQAELVLPHPGSMLVYATIIERRDGKPARARASHELMVAEPEVRTIGGHIRVTMERADSVRTLDEALWAAIHECSESIGFGRYHVFIRRVFDLDDQKVLPHEFSRRLSELGARGVGVYQTVRDLTDLFLISRCGPAATLGERFEDDPLLGFANPDRHRAREQIDDRLHHYLRDGELPYIDRVVKAAYPWLDHHGHSFDSLLRRVLRQPLFIELWHEMCLEHGMMMRTMDAVCARFQNIQEIGENDALAGYEISPLWDLSDFFWDWINHASTRLNPQRRIHEYVHRYGPTSLQRSVAGPEAADVRTAFPDAFTNLLMLSEVFYKEDNQTTVIADAFPALVALRELHQVLAMGAGNAAPPLTFQARRETLMTQLVLAQPELAAFLRTRKMVPYDEAWMGQVDAMKDLQGWNHPSISHYRDLAVFGERILVGIQLGDWTVGTEDNARNWLRFHRNAIKRFIHAYRAISGLDLSASGERPLAQMATQMPTTVDGRPALRHRRQPAASRLGPPQAQLSPAPDLPTRSRPFE